MQFAGELTLPIGDETVESGTVDAGLLEVERAQTRLLNGIHQLLVLAAGTKLRLADLMPRVHPTELILA
jgi:hypothetical protein